MEKQKMRRTSQKPLLILKEIALIGLMSAILLVVQISLAPLPNIELVSLLIILFTLHFKKLTLWIIYVFAVLEGLVFGFGIWWLVYLYIWTILFVVSWCFRSCDSAIGWAIISGFFGLLFGTLSSIPYFLMGGFYSGLSYIAAGIPFDLLHCGGNVVAALLLFHPLNACLRQLNQRFLSETTKTVDDVEHTE